MKRLIYSLIILATMSACHTDKGTDTPQSLSGMIQTDVPERPAGQEDMIAFAAPKLATVRVGIIGVGMRGPTFVQHFAVIPGVEVKAIADLNEASVIKANKILTDKGRPEAELYFGNEEAWKKLVERDDIDLVCIATNWQTHHEMAKYAMEHGKHVAVEVPGATTLEDIWDLINTSERTRKHCMMLENCVYDFFELTILNMAQKGLLGEILYAEGGYIHQLEAFWDHYDRDWRMEFNRHHRGDVYPTHGMGPACQILNIHRGDKMNYLVSMDSDPVTIPEFLKNDRNEDVTDFQNGQHTLTLIRTEKGKTIEIHHDVATARPYSRQYNVAGTKGYASKYPSPMLALDASSVDKSIVPNHEDLSAHSWLSDAEREKVLTQNKPRLLTELEKIAKENGGHGGMDFIMNYRLIFCLQHGLPLDMDVYDLAEWSCIGPLSAISLEHGSMPVAVPDFTRGGWNKLDGYKHHFAE